MLRSILFLVSSLIFLSGCNSDDDPTAHTTSESKETWTIMVYGNGDNNLSPQLIFDMLEMSDAGSSDRFNIVVQADFNDELLSYYGAIEHGAHVGAARYVMQPDSSFEYDIPKSIFTRNYMVKGYQSIQKSRVGTLGEVDMDDPASLVQFMNWSMTNYPADHYGVVFWGHGGQWLGGFGGDSQDDSRFMLQPLPPRTLAQSVKQSLASAGVKKLDFVAFDACLMGGLEVLWEFGELTTLILGNPEVDYGKGMDYQNTLAWLKDNPEADMLTEFAPKEVELWGKHHDSAIDQALSLHAAYDATRATYVKEGFDDFVSVLIEHYDELESVIPRVRRGIAEYNYSLTDFYRNENTEFVDIANIVWCYFKERTNCLNPDDVPDVLSQAAMSFAVKSGYAILYHHRGSQRSINASGVSIWYPIDGLDNLNLANRYANETSLGESSPWLNFLEKVADNRIVDRDAPEITASSTNAVGSTVQQGAPVSISYELADDDDTFVTGVFLQQQLPGSTNEYHFIGSLYEDQVEQIGQKSFGFDWDGNYWMIKGDNGLIPLGYRFMGLPVTYQHGEKETQSLIYGKAKYVPPGKSLAEAQEVMLIANTETQTVNAALRYDARGIAPTSVFIAPEGKLYPIAYRIHPDGIDEDTFGSESYATIGAEGITSIKLESQSLKQGNYQISVAAEDNYGNRSAFHPIDLTVE